MAKRKTITKKLRFEIFKRDSFTCQYCGQSAPDVILNVDHINPVSKGGENDILNLITSCFSCNSGKKHRLLSDNTVLKKQLTQLEELNEKRNQLDMLIKWREELSNIKNDELDYAISQIEKNIPDYTVSDSYKKRINNIIKKYGLNLLLKAIDVSNDRYLGENIIKKQSQKSIDLYVNKILGITYNLSLPVFDQKITHINYKICYKYGVKIWQVKPKIKECIDALREQLNYSDEDIIEYLSEVVHSTMENIDYFNDFKSEIDVCIYHINQQSKS